MTRFRLPALLAFAFLTPASVPVASQEKPSRIAKVAPKVLYAVPLVAKPGEKQTLTLRGRNLAAVTAVTVTGAGPESRAEVRAAKAAAPPGNHPADRVGDSEVEVELELPKDAKPGAVTLTAVSPAGESNPYVLLLRDEWPAVAEVEPNDGFEEAQPLAVPCAVEAVIKHERDVDVFRFEGKKGQTWRFEVQAARFGSPVDALLTVYDARKRVVGSADDTAGNPDPVLVLTLPAEGVYYVTVIEAHDLGGADFGYRLLARPEK